MNGIVGAFCGATAAIGVLIFITGWRGTSINEIVEESQDRTRLLTPPRGALGVAGFFAGWIVSGWPAVGILGAGIGIVVPLLMDARAARAAQIAQTEALATWAEMLRDTMSSHAGIRQALSTSAEVAPGAVRADVQRLAQRAERGSLSRALRQFAADVADPVSDLIAAALLAAAEGQARDLPALLAGIASSTRDQASMHLRVETSRAAVYAQARSMIGITLVGAVGLVLFSPEFMAPYDTTIGQFVLAGVCSTFVLALWMLVAMSRPATAVRVLSRVADLTPEASSHRR